MRIKIPKFSLVILIGPSSSGKTTFAKNHFKDSEIISSGYCRYLLSDDENNQTVSKEAFELMLYLIDKRLSLRKLTVVDATNVLENTRYKLLELAKKHHCLTVAIVFNMSEWICYHRNKLRKDRDLEEKIIKYQYNQMQYSLMNLKKEGLNYVYIMNSIDDVMKTKIYETPLYCDKSDEKGPFDIIGDIHGCYDELVSLLQKLGYQIDIQDDKYEIYHPEGRKVIFLGDLVDRGPKIVEVLKLVMSMVKSENAYCVQGNHDNKLYRKLEGRNVQVKNGLEDSIQQLSKESQNFIDKVRNFLKHLESHLIFDNGQLVVAHAGIKEEFIGRTSKRIRSFTLYGETSNEMDEFGLPKRYLWAKDYKGKPRILYGHTPNLDAFSLNEAINIDTGCVFGNKLTAYRYPEEDFVSVKALKQYSVPARPMK
ncbi:metallophosphoesterase [Mycoplasmatota bacterium]|nr:metallophosphoesterase [Mycoplasmatota bacterium]